MKICVECGEKPKKNSYKYCSNKCQQIYQYKKYIEAWKRGFITIRTKNISKHIKRYFIERQGERCNICSWSQKNPITNRVPLEIDHVDGNAENNSEENLRLICPNCHALTPSFRNLNKGKGRSWRMILLKRAGVAEQQLHQAVDLTSERTPGVQVPPPAHRRHSLVAKRSLGKGMSVGSIPTVGSNLI